MTASPHPKQEPEQHLHHAKRTIAMTLLGLIFMMIGVIWFLYWFIHGRFDEYTDDAYVNGNIIQLMPQVPGTVIAVNTDETEFVTQGQVLVKLDPADTEVAFQRSKAALAQTVRKVRQYYENAEQAKAAVTLRAADLMRAEADARRRVGLVGERAISQEEMQHYVTAQVVAKSQYRAALFNLRSALAVVENTDLYHHPLVESAKANFKTAFLNLKRTTIVAPVSGFVAKRSVQVGEQVNVNSPLLAIIPLHEIWVDANYKESQLGRLRINQPVNLEVDAYSDLTFHGKIVGFSAGTGSAFSLLPPQNATGNWIKIVQRLPVRIRFDADEIKKRPLQIGLSVRVTTDTHHRHGERMAAVKEQGSVYTTDVYANQLAQANQMIHSILQANAANAVLPKSILRKGAA